MNPVGTTEIHVPDFGTVKGHRYANGVRQFCGIPYGQLAKRWTRSLLNTSLPNGFLNGTKFGCMEPQPPEYTVGEDFLVPVPARDHLAMPAENEFSCLNLNIVLPPDTTAGPIPIMVWIHGGSFLFGHGSHPAYDFVNLVTAACERGTPVIGVSLNYRIGLFGFLASQAIKDDLAKDGLAGAGNFGLTDQQTALDWIQRYMGSMGGDVDNVTIFGESAGGMSVAHQIWARQPAKFHRAISMSGTLNTIPVWSLDRHENRWRALLRHLKIDPDDRNALEQARAVSQQELAKATCLIEGMLGATGNPCADGWYHGVSPHASQIQSPPEWLRSYMLGDVRHEAMIFHEELLKDTDRHPLHAVMGDHVGPDKADQILRLYDIFSDSSADHVRLQFEEMATDGLFVSQNWLHARKSSGVGATTRTYVYHMDQTSTLDNPLKGLAYHAIDILYVFLNLTEQMTGGQRRLATKVSGDFLDFAHGRDPWDHFDPTHQRAMVYGPDDEWAVKTAEEDEPVRRHGRMEKILKLGVLDKWVEAMDMFANKRWLLGQGESQSTL